MKERLEKIEGFAKEIICLAVKENMSVSELNEAVEMAKRISTESMVDDKCIDKIDYPSGHIVPTAKKALFV